MCAKTNTPEKTCVMCTNVYIYILLVLLCVYDLNMIEYLYQYLSRTT
jgi:hypothetical protein